MSVQKVIENGVENFLKEYRKHSHIIKGREDEYFWNERDCHWRLFNHLNNNFKKAYGKKEGSFWVHAEGYYEIRKRRKWKIAGRADLVIMDPKRNSRLFSKEGPEWEPYDAVIEMKLIWSGYGAKVYLKRIEADLKKLEKMLKPINDVANAKCGYFVLLDGLDKNKKPFFTKHVKEWSDRYQVTIYHWPHDFQPVKDPKRAKWKKTLPRA